MRPDFYDFGVHDMYMTFCEAVNQHCDHKEYSKCVFELILMSY